eukprot:717652-Rhodomonas_salina.2
MQHAVVAHNVPRGRDNVARGRRGTRLSWRRRGTRGCVVRRRLERSVVVHALVRAARVQAKHIHPEIMFKKPHYWYELC